MSYGHMLEAEAVFEAWAGTGCDLVVALGREGKRALTFDPERSRRLPAPKVARRAAATRRKCPGALLNRAHSEKADRPPAVSRLRSFCRPDS